MTPKRKPICDDENIHAHSTPFSWAVARLWRMWVSHESAAGAMRNDGFSEIY